MSAVMSITPIRETFVKPTPIGKISSDWSLALLGHVFTFISPDQLITDIRRVSSCWNHVGLSSTVIKGQLRNINAQGQRQLSKNFLSLWLSKEKYFVDPSMIRSFFRFQQQKHIEKRFYYHIAYNMLNTYVLAGRPNISMEGVRLRYMSPEKFVEAGEILLQLVQDDQGSDFDAFIKKLVFRSVHTYIEELDEDCPSFINLCTIRKKLLSNLQEKIDAQAYSMPFLTKAAFQIWLSLSLTQESVKQIAYQTGFILK